MRYILINTAITLALLAGYHWWSEVAVTSSLDQEQEQILQREEFNLDGAVVPALTTPEVVESDLPTDDLYPVDALSPEERAEYEKNTVNIQ